MDRERPSNGEYQDGIGRGRGRGLTRAEREPWRRDTLGDIESVLDDVASEVRRRTRDGGDKESTNE